MDRRFFLASALALSACATLPPPAIAPAPEPMGELEPLLGFRQDREGVVIRVASNGCTARAGFRFHADPSARTLAFARRRLDVCKIAPNSEAELRFTWVELGLPRGGRVVLLNPLAGRP